MEQAQIIANGDKDVGDVVRAIQDTEDTYRSSYLKTAHCLKVARTAIAYAIYEIESGAPGTLLINRLKKDQEYLADMMK